MLSCTWEHVFLLFLQCPSETFRMLDFRLELGLRLSTPKSQLAFPPKWGNNPNWMLRSGTGALGSLSFETALGSEPFNANSVPIVKSLACLPCWAQEGLCGVTAKAIFSYGLAGCPRAARNAWHERTWWGWRRLPPVLEVFLWPRPDVAQDRRGSNRAGFCIAWTEMLSRWKL